MKRLDTVLPDWNRTQWVSIEAKNTYEAILERIGSAWDVIEAISVKHDLRRSALQLTNKRKLESITDSYKHLGLIVVPLLKSPPQQPYTAEARDLWIAVVKNEDDAEFWFNNWRDNVDLPHREIGEMLGYPKCCVDFYINAVVDQKFVDTTWLSAIEGIEIEENVRAIHIKDTSYPESNPIWRWQNVKLIPHEPCSFNCPSSFELGQEFAKIGRESGFSHEIDMIYEMLSWPVEWSALHGIAEIRTPINKVSARTDMTPWKYVVQKQGTAYPELGASGITYPYSEKAIKINPVTKTKSFLKSLEDTSMWEENGFSNKEAMDHFHQVIIDAIGNPSFIPAGNVLDLGCGNGVLLERVVGLRSDLVPHGVEVDNQRYISAKDNLYYGVVNNGNMFDLSTWNEPSYSMVLLMPGRLIENPQHAEQVKNRLYEVTDLLLINLTSDWTQKYETIENIMNKTGLDAQWEPSGKIIHRAMDIAQLFVRKV